MNEPNGPSQWDVITGLLNLNLLALVALANEQGATAEDIQQKIEQILQRWSPTLPE